MKETDNRPVSNPADTMHSHVFGQDKRRPGELRTRIVMGITAAMMVVEIVAGIIFGSMALVADGMHMASHAIALGITVLAYAYARRHARNELFSFGTGKVNALGGFTGAVLLAIFALVMAGQSIERIVNPIDIHYDQAILVAILGLIVNGVSVQLLGIDHSHRDHDHDHDHNLRAAYLHVLADALTSVFAIVALLSAKYAHLNWMDPVMGIVGAILVSSWSIGLLRTTSRVLLDRQGPKIICQNVMEIINQNSDDQVVDFHLWSVGPGIYAAIISIVTSNPSTSPQDYKRLIPSELGLVHVNVEIHYTSDFTYVAD